MSASGREVIAWLVINATITTYCVYKQYSALVLINSFTSDEQSRYDDL